MPANFCLVCNKIILENPHIFLVKTGSKITSLKFQYWSFRLVSFAVKFF